MIVAGLSSHGFAGGTDLVTLKDGSLIRGEVMEMSNGELHIKTEFGVGDIMKVKGLTWRNSPLPIRCRFT